MSLVLSAARLNRTPLWVRRWVALIALPLMSALVSGCGGGAGAGGAGSTSPGTSQAPTLSLVATPVGQQTTTNSISLAEPAELKATVRDGAGKAVPNALVTFSGSGQVVFSPAATALTDSTGVATVTVAPAGLSVAGAEIVSAQATVAKASASGTWPLSIGKTSVTVSSVSAILPANATQVSAYGTATIEARVSPTNVAVPVEFSSSCALAGKADLPASVVSNNGIAYATYTDRGCGMTDLITAKVGGSSQTLSLVVAPRTASTIEFLNASPQTIVLAGTGASGYQQSSMVSFRVLDSNGQPMQNEGVEFSLSTSSGGILLDNQVSQTISKTTDSSGVASVSVRAGTIPTPVWVNARLTSNGTVQTQSNMLTISTGRPTQARFSISSTAANINGWNNDGVESTIIIRAADRLGNPVPNGTVVNFISEGAAIQPSCVTSGGTCSVIFTSQRSRPQQIGDNPRSDTGRVTVLAYALGEESFVDQNGNNVWDGSEPFEDLGFVYIDPIEMRPLETSFSDSVGAWTAQRVQYIPFVGGSPQNLACASLAEGAPSMPGTCDGTWGTAHVRRDIVVVLSGDVPYLKAAQSDLASTPLANRAGALNATSCSVAFPFYVQDVNGNPMPEGTTLAVDTSAATGLTGSMSGSPIPRSTVRGGTSAVMTVKGTVDSTTGACSGGGSVQLVVTAPAPSARQTSIFFTVAPPGP